MPIRFKMKTSFYLESQGWKIVQVAGEYSSRYGSGERFALTNAVRLVSAGSARSPFRGSRKAQAPHRHHLCGNPADSTQFTDRSDHAHREKLPSRFALFRHNRSAFQHFIRNHSITSKQTISNERALLCISKLSSVF